MITAFSFTNEDIDLLARLITAEAENQPFAGQLAVGCVVVNRIDMDCYPNSLHNVIFDPHQFAMPKDYYTEQCYLAAKAVLTGGYRPVPRNIDMFQRACVPYWHGRHCVVKIGDHHFYGKQEVK